MSQGRPPIPPILPAPSPGNVWNARKLQESARGPSPRTGARVILWPMSPPKRPDLPDYIVQGDMLRQRLGKRAGSTRVGLGKWLAQRRKKPNRYGFGLQKRAIVTAVCLAAEQFLGSLSGSHRKDLENIINRYVESPAVAGRSIVEYISKHNPEIVAGDAEDSDSPLGAFHRFVEALCRQSIGHRKSSPRRRNALDVETDCQEAEMLRKELEGRAGAPSRERSEVASFFSKALADAPRWVEALRAYPSGAARLIRRYSHELFELGFGSFARELAEIVLRSAQSSDDPAFDPTTVAFAFEMYIMAPTAELTETIVAGAEGMARIESLLSSLPFLSRAAKDNAAIASIIGIVQITATSYSPGLANKVRHDSATASARMKNPGYRLAASEFILDHSLRQYPDASLEQMKYDLAQLKQLHSDTHEPCRRVRLARKMLEASVIATKHVHEPSQLVGSLLSGVAAGESAKASAKAFGDRWLVHERELLGQSVREAGLVIASL